MLIRLHVYAGLYIPFFVCGSKLIFSHDKAYYTLQGALQVLIKKFDVHLYSATSLYDAFTRALKTVVQLNYSRS